jgi:hypothetical protein
VDTVRASANSLAISIHDGGQAVRLDAQFSTASTKTASEQSNPHSEKTAKKLSEVMKRVSGSQSDAEFMAKASLCPAQRVRLEIRKSA